MTGPASGSRIRDQSEPPVPVVLDRSEVRGLLGRLEGTPWGRGEYAMGDQKGREPRSGLRTLQAPPATATNLNFTSSSS